MLDERTYYAMPLFDRYDIKVEFERRTELAIRPFRSMGVRHGATPPFDLASFECEICPIELQVGQMTIETGAHPIYPDSGPDMQIHHTGRLPYTGDDELWHLYPKPLERHPDGEIFRGDLILISFSKTVEEANKEFDTRIAVIERILDHQKRRIEEFQESFPAWVRQAWTVGQSIVPERYILN